MVVRTQILKPLMPQSVSGVATAHILSTQSGAGLGQKATLRRAIVKRISGIIQGQNTSGVAAAHIRSSLTGRGIGQYVRLTAIKASGTVRPKLINVSQSAALFLTAQANLFVTFTGPGIGQIAALTRRFVSGGGTVWPKLINVMQARAVTLWGMVAKIIRLD